MACLKNPRRRIVIPIVKDMLQDDRVGARRQLFEEISGFDLHSTADSSPSECPCGSGCNMGKIEEHTAHGLTMTQDGGKEHSVSSSYIHQRLDSLKVVCIGGCACLNSAD